MLEGVRKGRVWEPLLDGESGRGARAIVAEIADAIDADEWDPGAASLAGGAAGIALFYAYLALVTGEVRHKRSARRHLNRAIRSAGSGMGPSLISGFAGVAWAVEHVSHVLGFDDHDHGASVDPALVRVLSRAGAELHYELFYGTAGLAVCSLERLPRRSARNGLRLVVEQLERAVERANGRATWFTPPDRLHEDERAEAPEGYYNVGVAHGVPGVLAPLAGAVAADVAADRARPLLDEAVAWILAQQLDVEEGGGFPAWIPKGGKPALTRRAWCYGAPGVAGALSAAGQTLDVDEWRRCAVAVAARAAVSPEVAAEVVDAGLCHGAAGLAQVFNRIHQATDDPTLRSSALAWLERTLEMHKPGSGVAGYAALTLDGWVAEPGFLTGAAGIGLALLAATSDIEPCWDRVLGLSVRDTST